MSSSQAAPYLDIEPSKLSEVVFKSVTWVFYGLAIAMAAARTGFRVYTFRRVDVDDCFLILASLCLTGTIVLIHILYPLALEQNQATLGQIRPDASFADKMLVAKKIESASSNLTWFCIYAVKYSYLFFFRKLLQRQKNFIIWWWVVTAFTTACAITGIVFDWFICPTFSPNFLEVCPVSVITYREHIWLTVTTVIDIVSDALIISIPVMILWRVKLPLRAKFGIGAALCLSLCMMIIAILRITFGALAPEVTDTVWTYFTFGLEASTAVFMVSATAFRSTFGHHRKGTKLEKSYNPNDTQMANVSRRGEQGPANTYIGKPQPMEWYEKEDACTKTIYQPEVEERSERARDMI